jgi:hypothetical protein
MAKNPIYYAGILICTDNNIHKGILEQQLTHSWALQSVVNLPSWPCGAEGSSPDMQKMSNLLIAPKAQVQTAKL